MAGKTVKIGNRLVGNDQPCYVVAEIGINHNGSLDTAKELIKVSSDAGCDAVKFQKRTLEVVYTPEELTRPRENPFGPTNGDLKRGLEFGLEEYQEIDQYCKELNIDWFVSCWDEASVDFIEKFNPPCYKIASASLTDDDLLRHHRKYERPIILSTGMSTMEEIEHAIEVLGEDDLVVLHSTSTYPAQLNELNLRVILTLKKKYNVPIGYSGHEPGLSTTFATAVMGASIIEKHITLDRALWGSDQAASVEPHGIKKLVEYITQWEEASGNGIKKVYDSEIPIREKLRRKG
jgi:N-acetylneuraminate synthase